MWERLPMLALELWINGVCTHHIVTVEPRGADFVVARHDLSDNGVKWPGDEDDIVLGDGTKIRAKLDSANQRLMLTAPPALLAPQVFDLHAEKPVKADAMSTGLILDYDFSGEAGRGTQLGFNGAASVFSPYGVLRNSGFTLTTDGVSHGARLDTSYIVDDPDRILSWSLGDAVSGGLSWSRSVRFAGFQIASDFSLRPDLVTIPLPQFFGDSAVPATVDVLVGATKVFETEIEPGPFELHNLPIVTGGSQVSVTVNDVLGRQTSQTIALFDTSDLLAPGLSEYSLEAGVLRRQYGIESFDYGQPVASATYRRGLTSILTGEAHGEFAQDLAMLGGGAIVAFEPYAILGLDVAGSVHDGKEGDLAQVTLQSRWDRFTVFSSYSVASADFTDLAALESAAVQRRELQLGLSATLDKFGSVSVAEIEQNAQGAAASRLITGSYSLGMDNRFLTLTGFYDRMTGHWYAGFTLDLLFGHRNRATLSGDTNGATASYAHDADPDGGFGYRAAASSGSNAGADLQGQWYGDTLMADAELAAGHDGTAARVDINGSLVVMGGEVFASRQSDGAVALVKTGEPGVHILRENRVVAMADANGEALVPSLTPFSANHISVDANDYPLSTVVETSERVVVPRRDGAVVVDLAPVRRAPVLVTIRLENGLFPPPGSSAALGNETYVVGRNGKLFIPDLAAEARVTVTLPDGACEILVVPPKPSHTIPKVGPLLCLRKQHAA
jgi:outer membrane usher protein